MIFTKNVYGGYIVPSNTKIPDNFISPSHSEFGDNCEFGDWCSFGEYCTFGYNATFGNHCAFEKVILGKTFKRGSNFGWSCSFDGEVATSIPIRYMLSSTRVINPNLNKFIG